MAAAAAAPMRPQHIIVDSSDEEQEPRISFQLKRRSDDRAKTEEIRVLSIRLENAEAQLAELRARTRTRADNMERRCNAIIAGLKNVVSEGADGLRSAAGTAPVIVVSDSPPPSPGPRMLGSFRTTASPAVSRSSGTKRDVRAMHGEDEGGDVSTPVAK